MAGKLKNYFPPSHQGHNHPIKKYNGLDLVFLIVKNHCKTNLKVWGGGGLVLNRSRLEPLDLQCLIEEDLPTSRLPGSIHMYTIFAGCIITQLTLLEQCPTSYFPQQHVKTF